MKRFLFLIAILLLFLHLTSISVSAVDDKYLTSDYEKTYIEYSEKFENSHTVENYLNMCHITFALNDFSTAKKYCKEALKEIEKDKHPDYELKSDVLAAMGELYLVANNNYDIVFDYLNKAREYKESNSETDKYNLAKLYSDIALAYIIDNNYNLAKKYWGKAIDIIDSESNEKYNALKAKIYFDMSKYEYEMKNFAKEEEYLEVALNNSINSKNYENYIVTSNILNSFAQYYKNIKKNKKSEIEYTQKAVKAIAKFPDKNLLTRETEESDENISIEDILKKLQKYPYDIDYNVMAGSYYIALSPAKSKEYFDKAIAVNPKNAFLYAAIANSYSVKYKEANFKEYENNAKNYARLAEEYSNYEPDIYLTLGLVYFNLRQISLADKYFSQYIKYSEDFAAANCDIASIYWFNDNRMLYRKYVIKYLETARHKKELNSMYKLMLIESYRQVGNTKKADSLATKLIKDEAVFEN
ncbi:hypothetical protein IJ182_09545 [bacterium]|nr:hypothetical protein [bacterium]